MRLELCTVIVNSDAAAVLPLKRASVQFENWGPQPTPMLSRFDSIGGTAFHLHDPLVET